MRRALPLVILAAVASLLYLWNLGGRYLWQDEAACALLAERMFERGKPLAYDGTNLVTMDVADVNRSPAEARQLHAGPAAQAVQFFHSIGDYKEDTTWVGQPWGQFVLAGLSMELLGRGTVAARLPFALAGAATVVLLFALVRRRLGRGPPGSSSRGDAWTAWLAAVLLLGNVFWFLHVRQCRYYASATLLMLLTFAAYLRWREASENRTRLARAALFVAAAWLWFHNDFGSPVPVLGVLFVDALLRERARWKGTLATFAALGASLLPFALYYELGGRLKSSDYAWHERLFMLLWNANQYLLPLVLVPVVLLLALRGRSRGERRVVVLALAVVLAEVAWMSAVAPMGFYRYVVDCTPLACLVVAFACVRGAELVARSSPERPSRLVVPLSAGLALVAIVTPWLALPVTHLLPRTAWSNDRPGTWTRPELEAFAHHLADLELDPNRAAVEFLLPRLRPGDEIAVNYEDLPVAFYTGHPVRGGIPAFRLFDPEGTYPRFFVFRPYVNFVYMSLFQAFVQEGERRGRWMRHELGAPGIPWGNNPDPIGYAQTFVEPGRLEGVVVLELVPK